ncbi:hypothetical protein [Burkholderia multivorans]|uniref:hypothetical protein n=1 Tax=Burkholderia multivorans TaxID=87883 RepID=UPI0018AF843B|nr:hypothetical protein [Burkholderia multivorans]
MRQWANHFRIRAARCQVAKSARELLELRTQLPASDLLMIEYARNHGIEPATLLEGLQLNRRQALREDDWRVRSAIERHFEPVVVGVEDAYQPARVLKLRRIKPPLTPTSTRTQRVRSCLQENRPRRIG